MPKAAKQPKETKTGRKKREKKVKDKNAPKRPLQPFMFFCQEQRDILRKDHPELSFTELSKILGDKWKQLTDKDKEPYNQQTEDDKRRYQRELRAYEAPED